MGRSKRKPLPVREAIPHEHDEAFYRLEGCDSVFIKESAGFLQGHGRSNINGERGKVYSLDVDDGDRCLRADPHLATVDRLLQQHFPCSEHREVYVFKE